MAKHTRLSRSLGLILLSTAMTVGLSACGGGSSSGSSTVTSTPTPTPAPTPTPVTVADEFPDNFSLEFAEGDAFRFFRTESFEITAPSTTDDVTASVVQSGDGQYFAVGVIASEPDADGVRVVQLEITNTADLDFEMPLDANGDNVYEFTVSGMYQNENLSANVSVTITDVPEPVSLTPRILEGTGGGQKLGAQIVTIDLDGDSLNEIALPTGNDNAVGSGLILDGVFLSNGNASVESLNDSSIYGTLFLNETDTRVGQLNKITAVEQRVLVSEELKSRLTLFDVRNDADRAALRGDVDLTVEQPNRAVYTFGDDDNPVGQIIPDVNGDGIPDIFVFKNLDAAFPEQEAGIIFGIDSITPENSARTGDFDLSLTYTSQLDGFFIDIAPHVVDLDNDGLAELILVSPGYTNADGIGVGRISILKSSVLRDGTTTLNLDTLTQAQGASLSGSGNPQYDTNGQEGLAIGTSFVVLSDFDTDGSPRLLFTDNNNALYSIDGDEMLSFQSATMDNFFTTGGYRLSSFSGFSFFAENVSTGFDLDGDTLPEIIISGQNGRTVQLVSGEDIETSVGLAASTPGLVETPIGAAPVLTFDLFPLNRAPSAPKPIYSSSDSGNGHLLFGDIGGTLNRGRLIIVEESDVRQLADPRIAETPVEIISLTTP